MDNLIHNLIHKKKPTDVPRVSGPEDMRVLKTRPKNLHHLSSHQLFSDQRFKTEIDRHATPRGQDGHRNGTSQQKS